MMKMIDARNRQDAHERLICPLDVDSIEAALQLMEKLQGEAGVIKVGLQLTTSEGIGCVAQLQKAGARKIFLDLKLHDIPNTVARAIQAAARLRVWCITLHASGGSAMLKAAREAAEQEAQRLGLPRMKLLGVTVLTSLSEQDMQQELRVAGSLEEQVVHLACLALASGCDGVVASPQEIVAIRRAIPHPDFLIITPGVRPAGSAIGDQARVTTPGEAIRKGASLLVVGRPITAAADPAAAARQITEEMAEALENGR